MTAWQIIDLTADFVGRLTAKHGHLLLDGQQLTHLDDALSLLVREDGAHPIIMPCFQTL